MWPEPAEAAGMPLAGLGHRMRSGELNGDIAWGWSQAVAPPLDPRAQVQGLNTTVGNYTLNQG